MTAQTDSQKGWSPETRQHALALYEAHGLGYTHHETGIPRTTLRRWAADAGLDPRTLNQEATARTEAARGARLARCETLRLELREQFLTEAAAALDRLNQPYVEFVGKEQVEYPLPPAAATWHLMKTAATALDKYRLEVGEATERTELIGAEPAEAKVHLAKVIDMELERRAS